MNPADLRRADWRFLLPSAAPEERLPRLLVAGGPSGLAGVLVDLRVAEAVEPEDAQSVSVDSIAVLSDARHPLERLVARLRPGGNLYYELDRRQLRHLGQPPAVIARRLRRLGLRVTGTYWAKPDFAHCEMYLPF